MAVAVFVYSWEQSSHQDTLLSRLSWNLCPVARKKINYEVRCPGPGTRKQFSIHIAQLLFDKHNYHPRLLTVRLAAAAVYCPALLCDLGVNILMGATGHQTSDLCHHITPSHVTALDAP